MNIKSSFTYIFIALLSFTACDSGSSNKQNNDYPEGLEFPAAADKQEFSDMLVKAMTTSRYQLLLDEYASDVKYDDAELREFILSYGQAISKGDWVFESYKFNKKSKEPNIGYRWIDKRNRTAIIVEIVSTKVKKSYKIKKMSFASRLDILKSKYFPGGDIPADDILLNSPVKKR